MTDWKDSYDSWKDSRLPRQLIAVLFSWKSLSHQSTGSWYKFFNCKMLRPARLTQLAGSTPQCRFHTDCHHPSKVVQMFHADLFLEFLLPYKGTANLLIDGKHIFHGDIFFYNDRSAQSLLERFTRFDCYFSRFVSTKVRCFLAVCIIFGRIHTTESFFDCTVPWWCSKYYASRRYLFFYAHKGFLKISHLGLKAIFKLNISFLTFPFSLF